MSLIGRNLRSEGTENAISENNKVNGMTVVRVLNKFLFRITEIIPLTF